MFLFFQYSKNVKNAKQGQPYAFAGGLFRAAGCFPKGNPHGVFQGVAAGYSSVSMTIATFPR